MLLFIEEKRNGVTGYTTFQNIVCYCLSVKHDRLWINMVNFKTSYVTVYHPVSVARRRFSMISKHRMLLFIRLLRIMTVLRIHFKTSYVTVYPDRMIAYRADGTYFKTSYVTVYRYNLY